MVGRRQLLDSPKGEVTADKLPILQRQILVMVIATTPRLHELLNAYAKATSSKHTLTPRITSRRSTDPPAWQATGSRAVFAKPLRRSYGKPVIGLPYFMNVVA
jgi:hypothetical protein